MASDSSPPSAALSSPSSSAFGCIPYSVEEEERISSLLRRHLAKDEISYRPGTKGGARYAYLDINRCVDLANHIFDSTGWASSVQDITVDFVQETKDGRWNVGLSVIMRVTLRNGAYHEDIGYGQCTNMPDRAAALEKAKKEGCSDGLKRALRLFGNKLGNCLTDKAYMKRLEAGQHKEEPIDLNASRKRMKLEEQFSAAAMPSTSSPAPPEPVTAPAQQSSPPPPHHPYQQPGSSPVRQQQPLSPPSAPAAAGAGASGSRPHFPLPTPSLSSTAPPAPMAPYYRPPPPLRAAGAPGQTPGAAMMQLEQATSGGGATDESVAAYSAAPYSQSSYGAATPGSPLPLPSISGIIGSLTSSQHTPFMPYALPAATTAILAVKQEQLSSSSSSFSMPPPPLPSHRTTAPANNPLTPFNAGTVSSTPGHSPPMRLSQQQPASVALLRSPASAGSMEHSFPSLPAGLPSFPSSARNLSLHPSVVAPSVPYTSFSHSSSSASTLPPSSRPSGLSPPAATSASRSGSAVAASLLADAEDDAAFFEHIMPSKPSNNHHNDSRLISNIANNSTATPQRQQMTTASS